MVPQDLDLRDIVKLNVKCIEFFGYFRPEATRKLHYYIYAFIFVGFLYVTYILSLAAELVVVFGDIEKMTDASFLTLSNLVQAFKLYPFIVHGSRVRKLINSINREEFRPRNRTQYKFLVDDIKMSQRISKSWLTMCSFIVCLLVVSPLLDKGDSETTRLPISAWFPFNHDKSPVFELVYAYQGVTVLVNALGVVCMDTFIMGIIMVISGQLSVLNNAFQIMRQESKSEARECLIRNVEHYRSIMQFADEMTSLFTACILSQFVSTAIISCINLLQLTFVPLVSVQFLSMFLYEGCVLLEIFLWCYYGNETILKSEQLTESAYVGDWADGTKEFKQNLLFFMTRSQFPLKLYAGGYFTLSLQTFMAIAKSSWSYFAVLKTVHAKDAS